MDITAERIKTAITNSNMTIKKIADLVGVHRSTLYDWMSGHVDSMKITHLSTIAKVCNVDIDWLLGDDYFKANLDRQTEELIEKIRSLTPQQMEQVSKFIDVFIKEDSKNGI